MTTIADEIGPAPEGFCRDCCFYEPVDGQTPSGDTLPVGGGICRRSSPMQLDSRMPYPEPRTFSQPRVGLWPMTNGNDWCGEHPLRRASHAEAQSSFRMKLMQLRDSDRRRTPE